MRNKLVPAKSEKTTKDCSSTCRFNCANFFDMQAREVVFNEYYRFQQMEKHQFVLNTAWYGDTKRKTLNNSDQIESSIITTNSRRAKSFKYFFEMNEEKIRVCKPFYLGTLSVSQKVVYNAHKKCVISEDRKDEVMIHISSFPAIDSRYCRAKTNKKYLESRLNLNKMHEMYGARCTEMNTEPVKYSYYRYIFNSQFNIDFHKPKSDRCDRCEAYKVAKSQSVTISEEDEAVCAHHIAEKSFMRNDRNVDRKDKDKFVVCFDLENGITLPKAEISSFFYKRKLTLYNLTAHTSTKRGYCAIWTELVSGRAGNDIASAAMKLLESILPDEPNLQELTTWSDSCDPQNRNSIMSYAMAEFLSRQTTLDVIMKYAVPGHSCIQEVENMHSIIEKSMRVAEFYSPVSFNRLVEYCVRVGKIHTRSFKCKRDISRISCLVQRF